MKCAPAICWCAWRRLSSIDGATVGEFHKKNLLIYDREVL